MYIKIHVIPDAKKEIVKVEGTDEMQISVRQPAEGNRANRRVLEVVRGLHPNRVVRLVSGHHSPHKIVSVDAKDD